MIDDPIIVIYINLNNPNDEPKLNVLDMLATARRFVNIVMSA